MATIYKTRQGHWRVQVRRKGKYVSRTFLLRSHADDWAIQSERLIDLGVNPSRAKKGQPKTFP